MTSVTDSKSVTGRAGCTVRALANVTGISIELANEIATTAGRKKGRGFHSYKLIEAAKAAGYDFRKLRMKPRTMLKFLREHSSGRFYVRRSGHAFAVVDGNVMTIVWGPRTRVLDAWQFFPGAARNLPARNELERESGRRDGE